MEIFSHNFLLYTVILAVILFAKEESLYPDSFLSRVIIVLGFFSFVYHRFLSQRRLFIPAKKKINFSQKEVDTAVDKINRHFKVTIYPSQIETALLLLEGNAVELSTGEGKTLAILLASLLAMQRGHRVIILTANDYLVKREFEWSRAFWESQKFQSNFIPSDETNAERMETTYSSSDVFYVSNSKIVFDYMEGMLGDKRPFSIDFNSLLICDEIDMVFIENATIPFIISRDQSFQNLKYLHHGIEIFYQMIEEEHFHFVSEVEVQITEKGYLFMEEWAIDNNLVSSHQELYIKPHNTLISMVNTIIQAYLQMVKNIDYVIQDDNVIVVNELTGRLEPGRKFNEPLQSILEFKEGLKIKEVSSRSATVYYQNFINRFKWKSGTSGTILSSRKEFEDVYNLDVKKVKSHFNSKMIFEKTILFDHPKTAVKQTLEILKKSHLQNRPVLILASDMLYLDEVEIQIDKNIEYQRIDALNLKQEAEALAKIGLPKQVTLSSHVTGRGSDVILGGDWTRLNSQFEGKKELKSLIYRQYIDARGGLKVIVLGLNASERIDLQAIGRGARQGLSGSCSVIFSEKDMVLKNIGVTSKNIFWLKIFYHDNSRFKTFIQNVASWMNYRDRVNHYRLNSLTEHYLFKFRSFGFVVDELLMILISLREGVSSISYLQSCLNKIISQYQLNLPFASRVQLISIKQGEGQREAVIEGLFKIIMKSEEAIQSFNLFSEELITYSHLQLREDPKRVHDRKLRLFFKRIMKENIESLLYKILYQGETLLR